MDNPTKPAYEPPTITELGPVNDITQWGPKVGGHTAYPTTTLPPGTTTTTPGGMPRGLS
jgi:hypothetical protein